jgi:uncharacterized protein YwqG
MEVHNDALQGTEVHADLWSVLRATAAPSLRLTRQALCEPADSSTRLGGLPLLPPGAEWPRAATGDPLSLIGVWNTNEINTWYEEPMLPPDQVLSFFYDAVEQRAWGFDPRDAPFWRVTAASTTHAIATSAPDGTAVFPSWSVTPQRVLTVPDMWDPAVADLYDRDRDRVRDAYRGLEAGQPAPRHRVFGWPEPVQDAMQLECQLASNGIHVGGPEGYRDPRVRELEEGASDWRLLWQIDTDEDAGWMWGDVGTIYYWIRRQDLAAGRFDRTWLVLQCG